MTITQKWQCKYVKQHYAPESVEWKFASDTALDLKQPEKWEKACE